MKRDVSPISQLNESSNQMSFIYFFQSIAFPFVFFMQGDFYDFFFSFFDKYCWVFTQESTTNNVLTLWRWPCDILGKWRPFTWKGFQQNGLKKKAMLLVKRQAGLLPIPAGQGFNPSHHRRDFLKPEIWLFNILSKINSLEKPFSKIPIPRVYHSQKKNNNFSILFSEILKFLFHNFKRRRNSLVINFKVGEILYFELPQNIFLKIFFFFIEIFKEVKLPRL